MPERDIMDVFRSDAAMRAFGVDRSPQGEDHGPEPDALGGLPPSQPKEDQ